MRGERHSKFYSPMDKAELRQQIRARRRALPLRERQRAAQGLCRVLGRSLLFLRASRIACYFAHDGELDPAGLMAMAWCRGKRVYVPVLNGGVFERMRFAPYRQGDFLAYNRYGIAEPPAAGAVSGRCLDLVLMPLVAFDETGNRLGMGGGFYDRSFAYLRHRQAWRKPLLLGVGYDFQYCPGLPSDPWDVPMAGVVTESRLLWFAGSE